VQKLQPTENSSENRAKKMANRVRFNFDIDQVRAKPSAIPSGKG
jgi:hypothetical protein